MKKFGILFTGLVVVMSTLTASAETEGENAYSKLFEEGKIWNVVDEYYDYVTDVVFYVDKQVSINKTWNDGDYLVTELNCFDMRNNTSSFPSLLEENRAVYTKDSRNYRKWIDFNLRKGDLVQVEDGEDGMEGFVICYYYVVNDEIIDIRGVSRRILSIGSEKDGIPFTYWIEGIGSVHEWGMLVYPEPTCSPYLRNRHISSCYVDDKCVFSFEDLEDYISRSGIETVSADNTNRGHISCNGGYLTVNDYTGNVTIDVYMSDGALCLSKSVTDNNAITISSLPSGCYLARATFQNGSSASLKFVKK